MACATRPATAAVLTPPPPRFLRRPPWGPRAARAHARAFANDPIDLPHDLSCIPIKTVAHRVVPPPTPGLPGGCDVPSTGEPVPATMGPPPDAAGIPRTRRSSNCVRGRQTSRLLTPGRRQTRMMCAATSITLRLCHNNPYRDGVAGATIAKNGGERPNNTRTCFRRRLNRDDRRPTPAASPRPRRRQPLRA